MTSEELLQEIRNAKLLESGANLTVPKSPRDGTLPRAVLHGWARVEVFGQIFKIFEDRKEVTIKRRLLKALDPKANLNAVRSRALREAFDTFITKVKEAADTAAEKRRAAEGPQIQEKISKVVTDRKEREKRANYVDGCKKLEDLFRGPLFDMGEDELLERFRLNRVKHIMDS